MIRWIQDLGLRGSELQGFRVKGLGFRGSEGFRFRVLRFVFRV